MIQTQPIWQTDKFSPIYQYWCWPTRPAYDGDTFRAVIELGLDYYITGPLLHGRPLGVRLRLARIDCPEMQGSEQQQAIRARDYVRSLLRVGQKVLICTYRDKRGGYQRLLVDVRLKDTEGSYCLNDRLVEKGLAIYKDYGL